MFDNFFLTEVRTKTFALTASMLITELSAHLTLNNIFVIVEIM